MKVWMFDYLGTPELILRSRVLPLRDTKLHSKTCVENKDKKSPSQTAFMPMPILLPKCHNSFLKQLFPELFFFLHHSQHNIGSSNLYLREQKPPS